MIPNDPKSELFERLSYQLRPLIPSHLGSLVGSPENAGVGGSIPTASTTSFQ
jgi:hypothetical protein